VGGGKLFLHHRVQTGSGAHPASYSMGNGSSFPGGKTAGSEADHSPPSSAEVKNAWIYTSTPQYIFISWRLIKLRGNFTFKFTSISYEYNTFSAMCITLKLNKVVVQRWATGWTIGVLGFDSRRELGIFLFTTASRTALWPTQPPIQWVQGLFPRG
jgi:hypothetical protein